MTPRTYIGIDPGVSGGIAILQVGSWMEKALQAVPMPRTERDIVEVFRAYKDCATVATIEVVHSMPQQGVKSTFTFGYNVGVLHGIVVSLGIRLEEVRPQQWQKGLGIPPCRKEETKTQFKNRLKAYAQQRFPQAKVTLATADAILIALYSAQLGEGRK